jgi:hypothetical protein
LNSNFHVHTLQRCVSVASAFGFSTDYLVRAGMNLPAADEPRLAATTATGPTTVGGS